MVYIDENLSRKNVPRGFGIFKACQVLGGALGFISGGALLRAPQKDFFLVQPHSHADGVK